MSGILAFKSRHGCKQEIVVSLPAKIVKHDCALSVVLNERINANMLSSKIFLIAVK